MLITNARVMNGSFQLIDADVRIEDGIITEIGTGLNDRDILDAKGCYLLPGFIDTHIHGACGARISDKDAALDTITRFEATQGVTSVAITTAASKYEDILRQLKSAKEASKNRSGSKIVGIHAEGPFISQKYKGAMTAEYILTPDVKKLDGMIEASEGFIKILTVAPETEGAIELISYAVKNGISVSMGHTDSDYGTALRAIEAGASRMTHTFNASRPINHREPGVLVAALSDSRVVCEMICDYVHLHPATVKMIYNLKGPRLINMISDSGHAAGLDVTEFEVDGVMRYVKDGVVRLANGTIAGSAMTLYDGFKNLVNSGIPMEDVSRMCSLSPAVSLGIDSAVGSIDVGKSADLILLDKDLSIQKVLVEGEIV